MSNPPRPPQKNYQQGRPPSGAPRPAQSGSLHACFKKGIGAQSELMDLAQVFAQDLVNGRTPVKHHQLRLLLDNAIRLKQSHKEGLEHAVTATTMGRLASIRPRIAYMAARERGLHALQVELDLVLKDKELFKTGADIDRLYEFVAAVVAYHRYEEANRN
ncbi:MAG: type III-A CRISPR-associated protein Csm2 [Candidatus Obscuribacterales bacterium]|jgi:CRISPR/Cas system CSM-associated protein Csm2 small subunit|nr:type III-A CRISPR-associated protein Csm2 [Candidatus Obscuribacterales bacterium]